MPLKISRLTAIPAPAPSTNRSLVSAMHMPMAVETHVSGTLNRASKTHVVSTSGVTNLPVGVVLGRRGRVVTDSTVKLFSQDVRVTGVPSGLGEHVDHDVEPHHARPGPPRHTAGCVNQKGIDRRVRVPSYLPVPVDDLAACLVRGDPQAGAMRRSRPIGAPIREKVD